MKTVQTNHFVVKIPEDFQLAEINKVRKTKFRADGLDSLYTSYWPMVEISLVDKASLATSPKLYRENIEQSLQPIQGDWLVNRESTFKNYSIIEFQYRTLFEDENDHTPVHNWHYFISINERFFLAFWYSAESEASAEDNLLVEQMMQSLEVVSTVEEQLRDYQWDENQLSGLGQTIIEAAENLPDAILENDYDALDFKLSRRFFEDLPLYSVSDVSQDFIAINKHAFRFVEQERPISSIGHLNHQLEIEFTVQLIDSDSELNFLFDPEAVTEGQLTIGIRAKGIYKDGLPNGYFEYEFGEPLEEGSPSIIFDGLNLGYSFSGYLEMKQGYLFLVGHFMDELADELADIPIKIGLNGQCNALDWSQYLFSYSEALMAESDQVSYLNVAEIKECFPKKILNFKQLKELTIYPERTDNGQQYITDLPNELGQLAHLERLSVFSSSCNAIPESVGQLSQLKELLLVGLNLKSLPEAVAQLPQLQRLTIEHCQLEKLPEVVNLPHVTTISLRYNQLEQIPNAWLNQPKLWEFNLRGNPWKKLQQKLLQFQLDFTIEERERYFDMSYKYSDALWNDEVFYVRSDAAMSQQLKLDLLPIEDEEDRQYLEQEALKAIRLDALDSANVYEVGQSRFGGMPDLPALMEYPKYLDLTTNKHYHYQFIAQLNCAALQSLQKYLPRDGMLYFFMRHQESSKPMVIYEADQNKVVSAARFSVHKKTFYGDRLPFTPCAIHAEAYASLPSEDNDIWYQELNKPLIQLSSNSAQGTNGHNGKSDSHYYQRPEITGIDSNNNGHAINCYVSSAGFSPQEQAVLRYQGKPEDWMILLTIQSDPNIGFDFGPDGEVSFVIHKSDLANLDFSRVVLAIDGD